MAACLLNSRVTDMRLPILYALTYPDRIESDLRFPVQELRRLDFSPPDLDKFPCLRLAYEAVEAGGAKTIALNAADEVAVAAFLEGRIGFLDIPATIEMVVDETSAHVPESIEEVLTSGCRCPPAGAAHQIQQSGQGEAKPPIRCTAQAIAASPGSKEVYGIVSHCGSFDGRGAGIMILVHEFGHYAAAKWFGVRVDVFSIGFGKRLVGFRRGDTDYRISALPLGGYVKMAGENPLESRSGAPDEFMSHPRWQRFVIAIAGPAMNILLAIVLLTGVFMVHYERPEFFDQPAVIGWVLDNSPAAKAGIEQGDRIVRIDGAAESRLGKTCC